MRPVSEGVNQQLIIPPQQRTETSAIPVKTAPDKNAYRLPEDVVTLSKDRSSLLASSADKKPSVPVTQAEKRALRESFSVYV